MQIAIMVVCTFIIAYVFDIGFFPAAIGGVIVGTIIWAVVQGLFGGGQPANVADQPQQPESKKQ